MNTDGKITRHILNLPGQDPYEVTVREIEVESSNPAVEFVEANPDLPVFAMKVGEDAPAFVLLSWEGFWDLLRQRQKHRPLVRDILALEEAQEAIRSN